MNRPNSSRDADGENKSVLELARASLDGIKGIRERLDDADRRINQLEGDIDAGRGGGSSTSAQEQKQRKAFAAFIRSNGESKAAPDEWMAACSPEYQKKAVTIGTDSAGGYAVPEMLENRVTRRLAELSPVRQVARVMQPMTSFDNVKLPISLGGTASGWVGETSSRTDTATPTLTVPAWPAAELYAMPKASQWSVDDWAAGTLEQFLADEVAEQFAIQEGAAFVSGNGSQKPLGFLNATPVTTDDDASPERAAFTLEYVALDPGSSPANGIQPDELFSLVHTLKSGYWPRATWLMNRATAGAIRKFKGDDGQYLWQSSLAQGQPNLLCGFPVLIVDAMPSIGQNNFPIVLGDWQRAYGVLEKPTRLLVDPYTDKPNVRFYWTKRVSGHTLDSHAAKVGRCAAA